MIWGVCFIEQKSKSRRIIRRSGVFKSNHPTSQRVKIKKEMIQFKRSLILFVCVSVLVTDSYSFARGIQKNEVSRHTSFVGDKDASIQEDTDLQFTHNDLYITFNPVNNIDLH